MSFADVNFKILHADQLSLTCETCMIYTIDDESFYPFMKNICIGTSGASCCFTNNDIRNYVIAKIDELVQGSSGNMKTKLG